MKREELARTLKLGDGPVFGFFGSLYRYEGVSWMIRAASVIISYEDLSNTRRADVVTTCGAVQRGINNLGYYRFGPFQQ